MGVEAVGRWDLWLRGVKETKEEDRRRRRGAAGRRTGGEGAEARQKGGCSVGGWRADRGRGRGARGDGEARVERR